MPCDQETWSAASNWLVLLSTPKAVFEPKLDRPGNGDLREVIYSRRQIGNTHLRIRVRIGIAPLRYQSLIGDSRFVDETIREDRGQSKQGGLICLFLNTGKPGRTLLAVILVPLEAKVPSWGPVRSNNVPTRCVCC